MTFVVTPKEMARIEKLACDEGCEQIEFMENAGLGIATETLFFIQELGLGNKILLLAGKGNNAGDGFNAALHLLKQGMHVVVVQPVQDSSPLCRTMAKRFTDFGGIILSEIPDVSILAEKFHLIIDALFGTGFHGKVEEPYKTLIETANHSQLPILAIDIPSGLNGQTGEVEGVAIHATQTLYLEYPKLGFFLGAGYNYIGLLSEVPFGLPSRYQFEDIGSLISHEEASILLPPLVRTRHKYQAGTVVGVAGSPGMPGAALLSTLAALRGGAGMVYLFHPAGMEAELTASPYELIKVPYQNSIPDKLEKANAVFVGPGMGQNSLSFLKELFKACKVPLVIDADALTLIANHSLPIPPNSLLTPHLGEMSRLLHIETPPSLDAPFLDKCHAFAASNNITLILKGAPTWIFHKNEPPRINTTGTPGMATAGSGDVLTGLLAALLAQDLPPRSAAILGTYLHGLAGEFAATEKTVYSLIASDLIEFFPDAYWDLLGL